MEAQVTENASDYRMYFEEFRNDNHSVEDVQVGEQIWLSKIATGYMTYHGYVSLVICICGILANIVNIFVLNTKELRSSSNAILTLIAVSDNITMLMYIPQVLLFNIHDANMPLSQYFSYNRVVYSLVASKVTLASHNVSVWLGVSLAVFRFMQSRSRHHIPRSRRNLQTVALVCSAFLISIASSVPNSFTNRIEAHTLENNETIYTIDSTALVTNDPQILVDTNVLLYAIVGKLLPCVLMAMLVGALVHSLHKRSKRFSFANRKRSVLLGRTNRLLYAIVVLFLITELPQGLLVLMCVFISGLYENVYIPLGDFFDVLALINCVVNFVLYCIMSSKFRNKFKILCCRHVLRK
ncbi:G-protein coupled receptor dmsr-1-like [Ostrea edulis]|uniref:G-protein coupled receptor dmsr-1-like n=1 Tax=Ostrea edulis TaxID=37623 RepID=UPI0024AFDDC9|nr:G-protein coupled receptor dmsr-1-like [Ostrea edulis]